MLFEFSVKSRHTSRMESSIHPRSTFVQMSFVIFMPILIMTFVSVFAAVAILCSLSIFLWIISRALICLQLT